MDLLAIFRTLSLSTLALIGPPRVASTPRSLAEKMISGTSSEAILKACLTVFLASGPTARMTVLVVWSFCPICYNPYLAIP
eukprot:10016847-Heterocapsa_arctica.AAC.1